MDATRAGLAACWCLMASFRARTCSRYDSQQAERCGAESSERQLATEVHKHNAVCAPAVPRAQGAAAPQPYPSPPINPPFHTYVTHVPRRLWQARPCRGSRPGRTQSSSAAALGPPLPPTRQRSSLPAWGPGTPLGLRGGAVEHVPHYGGLGSRWRLQPPCGQQTPRPAPAGLAW